MDLKRQPNHTRRIDDFHRGPLPRTIDLRRPTARQSPSIAQVKPVAPLISAARLPAASFPPRAASAGQPLFGKTLPNPAFGRQSGPTDTAKTKHKDPNPIRRNRGIKRHWSLKRKLVTSALAILLLGFSFGTWYGAKLLANVNKVFHANVFTDAHALFSGTTLKGEDQGRVNILLAGDSADDPDHGGADLTDSIMVVSIDTKNHTGFMLSIPRDLWVDVPGWSHQKINAANDVTNFSQTGYPSGGMGQLEQIVQTDLGIPIDYYALINYTAFKDAVDAVGGITIDIQSPDPRGIYDAYTNLELPNGEVTLNGQEALNLARARGDDAAGDVSYGLGSDYDRTQHQRQMLVALVKRAESVGVLANPLKVTQLFDAFGNNIETDLNLEDVSRLIQITKGMDVTKLQSDTYSDSGPHALLTNYTDPDSGQEALAPTAGIDNFSPIQQYYQQLTSANPVVREAATVVVLNASDVIGLAHKEGTTLQGQGLDVSAIADANNVYPTTMIVDNSHGHKPASKQLLQQLFPGTTTTNATGSTEASEAQGYIADFVVILGQNWDSTPH